MGTLNPPPIAFADGDDDFKSLAFTVAGGVLVGTLNQAPVSGGRSNIEESDTLAALPVGRLGGITKAQFREALRGWMLHLRAKAGIV